MTRATRPSSTLDRVPYFRRPDEEIDRFDEAKARREARLPTLMARAKAHVELFPKD